MCGGGGIRTPTSFYRPNGFQDRPLHQFEYTSNYQKTLNFIPNKISIKDCCVSSINKCFFQKFKELTLSYTEIDYESFKLFKKIFNQSFKELTSPYVVSVLRSLV